MYQSFRAAISYILFVRFTLGVVLDCSRPVLRKRSFDRVVGYEEEGGTRGGTHDCAAYAAVYAIETAGCGEAGRGLEAGF